MTIDDADLIANVDGTLTEQQMSKVLLAAEHDQQLANTLAALDASRLPYNAAYAQQQRVELPAELKNSVSQLLNVADGQTSPHRSFSSSYLGQGMAAAMLGVLCLFGGYLLGSMIGGGAESTMNQQPVNAMSDAHLIHDIWVKRVVDYQSLYVPDTIAGLGDGRADAQSILEGMRASGWTTVGIPDLTQQGYEFVRAQHLGFNDKPLVQLVYQRPGAAPLALCFMPATDAADLPVRLDRVHGLGTVDWIVDGQSYVVVAQESNEQLRAIQKSASDYFLL